MGVHSVKLAQYESPKGLMLAYELATQPSSQNN